MSFIKVKGRLAFGKFLVEPDEKKEGKNKYGCTILFDEAEMKKLETEIKKFKAEHSAVKRWKDPIHDGTKEKPDKDFYYDMFYINCTSVNPVKLVKRDGKPIPAELTDDYMYSGVDCVAYIQMYKYTYQGDGIGMSINTLQSLETGERVYTYAEPEIETFDPLNAVEPSDY